MNMAYTSNIPWLAYLVRHLHMLAKLIGPREDQAWILLEASADSDDIEAVLLKQIVCQVRVIDHAYNADGQLVSDRLLDLDSEWSLVRRTCVRMLQRVVAA